MLASSDMWIFFAISQPILRVDDGNTSLSKSICDVSLPVTLLSDCMHWGTSCDEYSIGRSLGTEWRHHGETNQQQTSARCFSSGRRRLKRRLYVGIRECRSDDEKFSASLDIMSARLFRRFSAWKMLSNLRATDNLQKIRPTAFLQSTSTRKTVITKSKVQSVLFHSTMPLQALEIIISTNKQFTICTKMLKTFERQWRLF